MKRALHGLAVIVAVVGAVGLGAGRADAQPAFALGQPLPGPELDVGTVSVRVIAGAPANIVTGTEVTLLVNGTPRSARTDSGGRAFFKDLPAGATVQAKILDEDKQEVASASFPLPGSGGVKVMLSTRQMAAGGPMGGGGGAPFAGGAASGMPEPRQLSGQPRAEPNDPAGTYTVRLTYDDLKEAQPPAGVPVLLVAYSADDSVHVVKGKLTGADGRVVFADLDRSGATSYFAIALIPRGNTVDRLLAQPLVMPPQAGVRVLLSSLKADDTSPPIDDLVPPTESATPAGKVRISLEGVPEPDAQISLVDADTHTVLAKVAQTAGPPDLTAISGGAPFQDRPDLSAGVLVVDAHGGLGNATDPLAHIAVRVIPADAPEPPADAPATETDASGNARLEKLGAGQKKAILTINGRDFLTSEFELSKNGGAIHVTAQWDPQGKPEAVIYYLPRAGQVVYAETRMRGQLYRTRPFVGVGEQGAHLVMQIFPRLLFQFSLEARVDDAFFNVQGRFQLFNNSWAPYAGSADGIVIPLPKGFVGGILAEQDQADVAIVPGEGFKLGRPIPPGGKRFVGGFALPVKQGNVDWALDLPFGAYQSGMAIQDIPGMSMRLPPNVIADPETDARGKWAVLRRITILPNQSMAMSLTGLPATPSWNVWIPRIVGILVIVVILAGVSFALLRRRAAPAPEGPARQTRRQKLLDELVELEQERERTPKQDLRREAVLAELEQVWDEN